jgi:YD repeat-containing protein
VASIQSSNANGASVAYTYDDLNRLSTVVDNRMSGNNTTSYAYDPASNLSTATYPNGVQSAMTYDALNRITGLATQNSGYLYQRGPTGNLTSATELNGRTVNWSFDGIYRLTNEAIASDPDQVNGSVGYQLDPVGNRTSETWGQTGRSQRISSASKYRASSTSFAGCPIGVPSGSAFFRQRLGGPPLTRNPIPRASRETSAP